MQKNKQIIYRFKVVLPCTLWVLNSLVDEWLMAAGRSDLQGALLLAPKVEQSRAEKLLSLYTVWCKGCELLSMMDVRSPNDLVPAACHLDGVHWTAQDGAGSPLSVTALT